MVSAHTSLIVALASAFVAAFAACQYVIQRLQQAQQSWQRNQQLQQAAFVSRVFYQGFPAFARPARALLQMPALQKICERLVRQMTQCGLVSSAEALVSLALCWLGCCSIIGLLTYSPIAALIIALVVPTLLYLRLQKCLGQRAQSIRDALPEALETMSSCFRTGLTIPQTFKQLEQESSGPLAEIFGQASAEMSMGRPALRVLQELQESGNIPELSFLIAALRVQHESGGSLQAVLASAKESLESELELKRSLKVHTAQAKLSAEVVVGVCLVLLVVLNLLSGNFLAPFFESAAGFALLITAVIMQLAGIALVRRLLRVEID